jgi:hypothetical protein
MRALALALVVFLGCSDDEAAPPAAEAAGAEPAPDETSGRVPEATPATVPAAATKPAAPAANRGQVDLTFAGMIEGTYQARAAQCGAFTIEGQDGRSVKVTSSDLGAEGDWDLTLMATHEPEFDRPAVILNTRGDDRASFTYRKTLLAGESIALHRDGTGADINLTLKDIAGSATITVTGTMRCP